MFENSEFISEMLSLMSSSASSLSSSDPSKARRCLMRPSSMLLRECFLIQLSSFLKTNQTLFIFITSRLHVLEMLEKFRRANHALWKHGRLKQVASIFREASTWHRHLFANTKFCHRTFHVVEIVQGNNSRGYVIARRLFQVFTRFCREFHHLFVRKFQLFLGCIDETERHADDPDPTDEVAFDDNDGDEEDTPVKHLNALW